MALGPSLAVAAVLLAASCCLQGAQGTSPPYPPLPPRPVCPRDAPLIKVRFGQGEYGRAQALEYDNIIPTMSSFTIHYWFNLEDTTTTHTMFNYAINPSPGLELLEVQLESRDRARLQFWKVTIKGVKSEVSSYPPITPNQWHHALHSWDSSTGIISHYIDGQLLKAHYNYETKGLVIPTGGVAQLGQTRNARFLHDGVDQGKGLNGWITLFQLSAKPIGVPTASDTVAAKAERAFKCEEQEEGEVISWSRTPTKGFGGVTMVPSYNSVCGHF